MRARFLAAGSRDEGFSTVVVMGMAVVLMTFAAVAGTIGTLNVGRHRAESAADLAALAAAGHALEGQDAACTAARRLTEAQHVTLLSCRLDGPDAVVTVGVAPPGRLSSFGLVQGQARAGRR